jgi:hypothetical protein
VDVDGRNGTGTGDVEWLDVGPTERPAAVDPRGRRWRGWYALAAAVVAAGVLVVAVRHGGGTHSAATPSDFPSTSTSAPESAQRSPAVPPPVLVTDVGHPLLGVPRDWELVARGASVLIRLQLARGRIIRTTVPTLKSGGGVSLVPGPDRVIVQPLDAVPGYEVRDGRPSQALPAAFGSQGMAFPGPDPAHLWFSAANHRHMILFGFDGRRAGPALSIPVDTVSMIADESGYLMFYGSSGVYDVRPSGISRITSGELIAAGPTRWLIHECDGHYRCSTVVIDRRTGARRTLRHPVSEPDQIGVISPDGATAAVLATGSGSAPTLRLIDLSTGVTRSTRVTFDPENTTSQSFVWSPDSRWLFTTGAAGRVAVVSRASMRTSQLVPGLPSVSQVAFRTGVH